MNCINNLLFAENNCTKTVTDTDNFPLKNKKYKCLWSLKLSLILIVATLLADIFVCFLCEMTLTYNELMSIVI